MKKHFPYGLTLLAFAWLITACLEEKEISLPFSFNEPRPGQTIWNNTEIVFSVPSEFKGSIDVQSNGQSIAIATSAPYQITWNTNSLPDGDYKLLAVATSHAGEKTECTVDVIIRNTLLTLDVPDQHIVPGMQSFIFLSDNDGYTIAKEELKNGEHVELKSEEFNGSTFTVNEVYLRYPCGLQVFSVTEMKRGVWTLNKAEQYPAFVGSIEVKSETTPLSTYYLSASGDSDFIDEQNDAIILATTQSSTKLFVRDVGHAINRYTIQNNVNIGALLNFPFSEVTKPLKTLSTSLSDPDLIGARVRLFGFPNVENFNEYYPLGVFFLKDKEIKIEYPEEFMEIGSESYYRNKRVRLYSFHPRNKFDFKTLNAQIYISTKDEQTVDLATFGEFDIYMSSWYYFNEQTNSSASWVMIGPSGRSQKLSVPDLPYEINERVPNIKANQLMYAGAIQVSDYAAINGYTEYLQFISGNGIDGPYKFGRAWKEQIFTESGHTPGRSRSREVPMLVEMLKIVD
ncbi:MAG: Ig-like domain-containing protein [Cyclobacteriaceae bacterium]